MVPKVAIIILGEIKRTTNQNWETMVEVLPSWLPFVMGSYCTVILGCSLEVMKLLGESANVVAHAPWWAQDVAK